MANYELVKMINEQRTLSIDFGVQQGLTTVVPQRNIFLWRLGIRISPEKQTEKVACKRIWVCSTVVI